MFLNCVKCIELSLFSGSLSKCFFLYIFKENYEQIHVCVIKHIQYLKIGINYSPLTFSITNAVNDNNYALLLLVTISVRHLSSLIPNEQLLQDLIECSNIPDIPAYLTTCTSSFFFFAVPL